MDRYIGDIINSERTDTRNGDTSAIADSELVRFNQAAQDNLVALISLSYNWVFEETITIAIVGNEDEYTINDNLAFGTRITNVEYSHNSDDKYIPLKVSPDRYTSFGNTNYPRYYKRRHGRIILDPKPTLTQGTLRVTYERAMDRLSLRLGQVNGTPSSTNIDLTHSTFGAPSSTTEALLVSKEYISICDYYGNVMLRNGVISSYNAGTDVITLAANVSTYLVGSYTLADLADGYLTVGKYTCTHSQLPNEAEAYLIEYVNRKIHSIDASDQFATSDEILKGLSAVIVASFKMPDKARKEFPIVDNQMLIPGYD